MSPHPSDDPHPALWFTRDALRRVDELAVERYAIPSIVLMENAARACARVALEMTQQRDGPIVIFCGPGNNGGDGFAMARHLQNAGRCVRLIATREPEESSGDARINAEIVRRMDLDLRVASEGAPPAIDPGAALLIDALLGTGLREAPRGVIAALIGMINEHAAPALAVDLPSGLDADRGVELGEAVRADRTVSFVGMKRGFAEPASREFTGRITIGDIGAPRELLEELGERRDS